MVLGEGRNPGSFGAHNARYLRLVIEMAAAEQRTGFRLSPE
jgi:hypothetical protein